MQLRNPVNFQALKNSLGEIYSTKNDESKGRLIILGSTLMTAFYNVFITGIFYTGFLAMYDISITGVGIVSFIPYIASCFGVFSSSILERLKKRKLVLLAAKVYFYVMYIIATNLMPLFVTDPDQRLVWFVIILFLANSVYALFSPGMTSWFYHFYPQDNDRRTRFVAMNHICSSVLSSVILLLSGVLADAVAGSPMQDQLILGLRYFAFVLVLIDVSMQACAKEYPYPEAPKLKLTQVFTLPFKHRKFLMCMMIMFAWHFTANLNNGLWNYHLLDHLGFSYTLLNAVSVMYTVILLCTGSLWQRILCRYSWIKTLGFSILISAPLEIALFILTPGMALVYLVTCFLQNLAAVGINFSYANILYMNLPEENSTAYVAFNTIGCNVFAFFGMITGTYISSLTGDDTIPFLWMDAYSVQFTTLLKAVLLSAMGLVLTLKWKEFTKDEDIAEIMEHNKIYQRMPSKLHMMPHRPRDCKGKE